MFKAHAHILGKLGTGGIHQNIYTYFGYDITASLQGGEGQTNRLGDNITYIVTE